MNRKTRSSARARAMTNGDKPSDSDKPVRMVLVYADGRVNHRDLSKGRTPWNSGAAWGRAGAHALPNDGPGDGAPAPVQKVKNPAKVAAGKARAAQAAARKAEALNGKAAPAAKSAKKAVKRSTKPTTTKAAKKASPFPTVAKSAPAKRTRNEPSGNAMVVIAFRGTKEQAKKFAKLGSGVWARARIDAAK